MYLGAVLKQAVELTGPAIWLYWSLATGAAIFALLPLRGASGFRWGDLPKSSPPGRQTQSSRLHLLLSVPAFPVAYCTLPVKLHGGLADWPPPPCRHAVLLSACRGKLWEGRPAAKLGPLTAISVPQSWFGHFYLIGVCVNLGLIVLQLVTAKRGLCLEVSFLCVTPAVAPI